MTRKYSEKRKKVFSILSVFIRLNLMKTDRILKMECKLVGRLVFECNLPSASGAICLSFVTQKYQHGSKVLDRLAARSNNLILAEFD